MLAPTAIAVSAVLILILCAGDPKRRRASRLRGDGQGSTTRRLLAAGACLPGLWCLGAGHLAAFLMWVGGCAIAGWLISLSFGRQSRRGSQAGR